MATPVQDTIERVRGIDIDKYKYGFTTDIESVRAPKGLSEDIVRFISAKKGEPKWLLEWRLEAYRRWRTLITRRSITRIYITTRPRYRLKGRRA